MCNLLSHGVNSLPTQHLSDTVSGAMVESVARRVRRRVREELDRLGVVQRDIAGQLKWSQAKVAQKLGGRTPWTLEEFEALCFIAGISPTEAVRDRGVEFCAEMTPTELRFLEIYRGVSQADRDSVVQLLTGRSKLAVEDRRAAPPKKVTKRNVR